MPTGTGNKILTTALIKYIQGNKSSTKKKSGADSSSKASPAEKIPVKTSSAESEGDPFLVPAKIVSDNIVDASGQINVRAHVDSWLE